MKKTDTAERITPIIPSEREGGVIDGTRTRNIQGHNLELCH